MAWIAPIIAAQEQRQTEERLLAELIAKDAKDEYEYKIVTSSFAGFRKPERLQSVLEEESRAQWQLVIKLDDNRIVLRRPRRAQAYDVIAGTSADPYRTQIGGSKRLSAILALTGILMLGIVAAVALDGQVPTGDPTTWPVILTAVAAGLLVVLLVAIKRSR